MKEENQKKFIIGIVAVLVLVIGCVSFSTLHLAKGTYGLADPGEGQTLISLIDAGNYCTYAVKCTGEDNDSTDKDCCANSNIKVCPKGSYCTGGVKEQCPDGFYIDEEGQDSSSDCTLCPDGYWCSNGIKNACDKGSEGTGTGNSSKSEGCSLCPAGEYAADAGTAECSPCSGWTDAGRGEGADFCNEECPTGKVSNAGQYCGYYAMCCQCSEPDADGKYSWEVSKSKIPYLSSREMSCQGGWAAEFRSDGSPTTNDCDGRFGSANNRCGGGNGGYTDTPNPTTTAPETTGPASGSDDGGEAKGDGGTATEKPSASSAKATSNGNANNNNNNNNNNNVSNPQTGAFMIIMAWGIGLAAIVYSFWYFKKSSSMN